jgi:hypothetical protein
VGRLIAPYLTKFIPGDPNAIIQNMAGAGSMVAANYIYGVAKLDERNYEPITSY